MLNSVKVADLTWAAAGPYCSMLLGDLGAEVVKVEQPAGGDPTRLAGFSWVGETTAIFLAMNRNKRSIVLDLHTDKGKEALARLVTESDVLLANYRPGVLERFGFGESELRKLNPRLIICCISGFGQTGPYKDWAANDLMGQAMAGLIAQNGPGDGTPTCFPAGLAVADFSTGLNACIAILAALLRREAEGDAFEMTTIDVNLLSSTLSMLSMEASAYLNAGTVPKPHGGAYFEGFPYESFATADYPIAIVATDRDWAKFCTLLECHDLAADESLRKAHGRLARRSEIRPILAEAFKRKTAEEWARILTDADIFYSPVYSMDRVFEDPQVQHMGLAIETDHPVAGTVRLADSAWKFARGDGPENTYQKPRRPPPMLGEHTLEILAELGYGEAEIDTIVESGDALFLPGPDVLRAKFQARYGFAPP